MEAKWLGVGVGIFLTFLLAGVVLADKVVLENGDTLTGKVEKVMDGKLTLKTDYSGPIEIQVSKIKKIYTDGPAEVHLTSGEVLKGKIETKEDGQIVVEKSPERETTTVVWPKVASVNPPPPKVWSGSLNAGGTIQTGNTDRMGFSLAAQLTRKTDTDRLNFRYLFNYAEEDGTMNTRNNYGEASYNYFFTKKFYGYGALELYNDVFKDYRLRTIVGPGVGYQVWDDAVKSLSLEAGLSYQNNNYYHGDDASFITARFGLNFRYNIFKWLTFTDQFLFYPSIGEGGDYTLRNEAALIVPMSSRWALRLANIFDYNSSPVSGYKRQDVQYILTLQYSF